MYRRPDQASLHREDTAKASGRRQYEQQVSVFEIKKTDQGGSLPVRWTIPWLIMSPQEIANLRGFSKLKEGRDWKFELQLTKYGNLLSVNYDT